ncbi:RrF2 family transcriptional regulator [Winogradskyella sp.]
MVKSRFAIVTHILTLLAMFDEDYMSSNDIAGSLNINPVLVRKEIAELKKQGLIESKEGKNGGVKLIKKAEDIKLSQIFNLVKGDSFTFGLAKNDPNPKCPVGRQMNTNLSNLYKTIDNNIEQTLKDTSLKDFKNQF